MNTERNKLILKRSFQRFWANSVYGRIGTSSTKVSTQSLWNDWKFHYTISKQC